MGVVVGICAAGAGALFGPYGALHHALAVAAGLLAAQLLLRHCVRRFGGVGKYIPFYDPSILGLTNARYLLDTIFARDGERDTIDCGAGRDKVTADRVDRVKNCERVTRR